jgi:hypothetical protein
VARGCAGMSDAAKRRQLVRRRWGRWFRRPSRDGGLGHGISFLAQARSYARARSAPAGRLPPLLLPHVMFQRFGIARRAVYSIPAWRGAARCIG